MNPGDIYRVIRCDENIKMFTSIEVGDLVKIKSITDDLSIPICEIEYKATNGVYYKTPIYRECLELFYSGEGDFVNLLDLLDV